MRSNGSRTGLGAFCLVLAVLGGLALTPEAAAAPNLGRGAVYVMSNDPDGNSILVFRRFMNGKLALLDEVSTDGLGNGTEPDALLSQGSLVLSDGLLFAVNAGSDEISVLEIDRKKLRLLGTVGSGGDMPTTLAVFEDLIYVVNAGDGEVTGFRIGEEGNLTAIAGSTRTLSGGADANPSQVSFTPSGRSLIVTAKGTNTIETFPVNEDGTLGAAVVTASNGPTPFGFDFSRRGHLIVSEAAGGDPGAGAASSYRFGPGGLTVVSGSVGADQTATCWVVTTRAHAYMTNTGSGTISHYRVGGDGTLTLRSAVAAQTGGAPIDMALDRAGEFLYVVVNTTGRLAGFRIEEDGRLTPLRQARMELPPFAQGIAAE